MIKRSLYRRARQPIQTQARSIFESSNRTTRPDRAAYYGPNRSTLYKHIPPGFQRKDGNDDEGFRAIASSIISHRQSQGFKYSLYLLAVTLGTVVSYTLYKTKLCHETVFLPLYPSPRKRKFLKSELDPQLLIAWCDKRVKERVAIDQEVHKLIGIPLEFPESEDIWHGIYVRSSEPSIVGLTVEPSWKAYLTSRLFSVKNSSDSDDQILEPYASTTDEHGKPTDTKTFTTSGQDRIEAVVNGKIHMTCYKRVPNGTININSDGPITSKASMIETKAVVFYTTVQSLDHPMSAPKITSLSIQYNDLSGKQVQQRVC